MVVALPSWDRPKLLLPFGSPRSRWLGSRLYPAFRVTARVHRLLVRVRVSAGMVAKRVADSEWVLEMLPEAGYSGLVPGAVIVGTGGPTQKITVQLVDQNHAPIAYLKYGQTPGAVRRIYREFSVLSQLTGDVAPDALWCGALAGGSALMVSAVLGTPLEANLPPGKEVIDFLKSMPVLDTSPNLESVGWFRRLLAREPGAAKEIELLAGRAWPVVPVHGDFTPWNVLRVPGSSRLKAIDWEYGALDGVTGVDLAFYALQVSALVYRSAPNAGRESATGLLMSTLGYGYTEAEALTRLTALDAYLNATEDGHAPAEALQLWRRQVWEGR